MNNGYLPIVILVSLTLVLTVYRAQLMALLGPLIIWTADNHTLGLFVFILLFGILTACLVPATLPTLVAGWIFGFPSGTLVSLAGSQIGIILVTILVHILYGKNSSLTANNADKSHILRHFDRVDPQRQFQLVILLRIAPVIPFGLCNYLLASTKMPLLTIMGASLIGNLPGCLIYSFVGHQLKDLNNVNMPLKTRLVSALVGICACVVIGLHLSVLGKAALRSSGVIEDENSESGDLTIVQDSLIADGQIRDGEGGAIEQETSNLSQIDKATVSNIIPASPISESGADLEHGYQGLATDERSSHFQSGNATEVEKKDQIRLNDGEKRLLMNVSCGALLILGVGLSIILLIF